MYKKCYYLIYQVLHIRFYTDSSFMLLILQQCVKDFSLIGQNAYLNSADSKSEKRSEKIRKGKMSFTDTIVVRK